MADNLCHCGQPLHYSNSEYQRLVEAMIAKRGQLILIRRVADGRAWMVPRHYIALHGIEESKLHTYGFQEVSE